jgi:hypothetical protein
MKVFILPLYDPSHQLSKSSYANKYTELHQKCTILKNVFKTLLLKKRKLRYEKQIVKPELRGHGWDKGTGALQDR